MIGRLLLLYSIIFYTFSASTPPETTFSLTHAYYHDRRTNSISRYQRHAHASTRQDAFVVKTATHSFSRRVPNVTDRATVISLAKMAYDAYTAIGGDDWYDLDNPSWPINDTFGWQEDGFRGHVFSNDDASILVIAIKGTTAGLFSGGPTGDKDKMNVSWHGRNMTRDLPSCFILGKGLQDNLLFSCCCGRISRVWTPVCECYRGNDYICEEQCLQNTIQKEDLYYDHALAIYRDISDRYETATVFLTGHSLGGALATLVGLTYDAPAVSFESPGDRLAAKRLHLPHGPSALTPIYHFGHTADPIFVGLCTGVSSACWYGGFAIETRCHTGKACVWDTVNSHNWKVNIASHRIGDIIEKILNVPEEFPLPQCRVERDCMDCGLWDFPDNRDTSLVMDLSRHCS
ncbi:hypothetical protein [Absidia glauca]|uniref:triacylglycerol lipase n=1 Tax=Absidia glauca TaxID=4829 RepID=A0A168MTA2_ABSGL|nr:hypothetical protein [Absidia glauca]